MVRFDEVQRLIFFVSPSCLGYSTGHEIMLGYSTGHEIMLDVIYNKLDTDLLHSMEIFMCSHSFFFRHALCVHHFADEYFVLRVFPVSLFVGVA
jgi:hypothetical protein